VLGVKSNPDRCTLTTHVTTIVLADPYGLMVYSSHIAWNADF
jgi:hypothetical protein